MSAPRLRSLVPLLAVTAACAPAPGPGEVATANGCFALFVANWTDAVAAAIGLRALPPYVALDVAPFGIRGRRIIVPATWEDVGSGTEWASWRVQGRDLVVAFRGSRGTLEFALHRTVTGYVGEDVTPHRFGTPPVQMTLTASSCAGLRPGPT